MADENKVTDLNLGAEQNSNPTKQFSAKEMLEKNAKAGTKIKYTDRMKVEILVDTRYYKKCDVVNPHKVKGQALIDQKIAKKYVEKED